MTSQDTFYHILFRRVSDPKTVGLLRRALRQNVVLDTWMNGEIEEGVSEDATALLVEAAETFSREAVASQALFPELAMPPQYVRTVFQEMLQSMALFAAVPRKTRRQIDVAGVRRAVAALREFVDFEPEGLTAVGVLFVILWSYADLNALNYYRRMPRDDFLLGTLHRPWSTTLLSIHLNMYKNAGLVEEMFTGDGDMLTLTAHGQTVLGHIDRMLDESGELNWRANQQRWEIFRELDYDTVITKISPDFGRVTDEYLDTLPFQPGWRVLEIGSGTGRVTVDRALCRRVLPEGRICALDPTLPLLKILTAKCEREGILNVDTVMGRAEALPFPDNTFDATIAVFSLHFTDADIALREMVRVTKPGGLVSALSPAPDFDIRKIPMVALWLRPLSDLAERLKLPFGERQGFPVGRLEAIFRQSGLTDVSTRQYTLTGSAEDPESFLLFFLKGAAFFQNIMSRLPYAERWNLFRRLDEMGRTIAALTSPEEKRHNFHPESVTGRVPIRFDDETGE